MGPSKTNHQQASEPFDSATSSTRQTTRVPSPLDSLQSVQPSNPSRSPTPHPHRHRYHPQQQQHSQQRSSSSTSDSDSRPSRNCGRYQNCRCGCAGLVCWRGRRELCGRAWGLVGGGRRRRKRRSFVVVALRISRGRRKMGERNVRLTCVGEVGQEVWDCCNGAFRRREC